MAGPLFVRGLPKPAIRIRAVKVGFQAVCHERTDGRRRCDAVREMRVGPSGPAVRCRPRTTASCCRKERWWRALQKCRDTIPAGTVPRITRRLPPSPQHHYRAFITTTSQAAPLRRIGTFGLAVVAACAFSLGIAGQVLRFRKKSPVALRATYMPDAARAAFRQPPNSSQKMGQPPVSTSPNPLPSAS